MYGYVHLWGCLTQGGVEIQTGIALQPELYEMRLE